MPKTKQQKEQVIDGLNQDLAQAKSATLASFSALPVSADQELRKSLRQENISYAVVKKTLLTKVFDKLGYPTHQFKDVNGNISLAISADDEVAPAKTLNNFMKNNESLNILGGILENKWIDQNKVKELAQLLSKPELIAKTIGTIKAPITGLVNVLSGNLRGLVNALKAIKDTK